MKKNNEKLIWIITIILSILILAKQSNCQKILIHSADTIKIKEALKLVRNYEQDIYANIIDKSIIQFGILPDKPTVNFAISEESAGQKYHWIMLNPILMSDCSKNIIATVIVHEAMHLGFNMGYYQGLKSNDYEDKLNHEHVIIYNYEQAFLKKIGASKSDVEGRLQIMKQLSIPIK